MPEEQKQPEQTYNIPPGFMTKAIEAMPRAVLGLIGSFLGVSIAFVIVLQLGGLDAPFSRIVNAYATGLEKQMTEMSLSSGELTAAIKELRTTVANTNEVLAANKADIDAVRKQVSAMSGEMIGFDARFKTLESKLSVMEKWACDHQDKVAKPNQFGATICREALKTRRVP